MVRLERTLDRLRLRGKGNVDVGKGVTETDTLGSAGLLTEAALVVSEATDSKEPEEDRLVMAAVL